MSYAFQMAKTRFGALSTKRYLNINVRNSLVGGKNIIDINSKSNLNWYACGPTVYDVSHLGHARTYICTDVIRRILSNYFKVSVNFVLGMTDLDDKIINRAKSKDVDWNTLARQYENEFFADMISLNVLEPDAVLRVTEHIPEIIKYIEHIMVMGKAYHIQSGVYFDIKNCKSYKKLSPDAGTDSVEEGNEGDVTSSGKRDPRDFVLWKAAKPGEPSWPSPWGLGRPGWHIECSAATHAMFGDAVHIHSGGIDLKFPHHTNEIAQCEAHNNKDSWVDYWLHTGHLYIDGLKMSKSLKNFISIRDYLNSNWSTSPANDLRLFFLQHKYHSALHLSKDSLKETAILRNRIEKLFKICHLIRNSNSNNREGTDSATHRPKKLDHHGKALYEAYQRCKIGVNENLRNDFDTPSALNNMMELVSLSNIHALQVLNNNSLSIDPLPAIEIYIKDMLTIFGFDVDSMMDQNVSTRNVTSNSSTLSDVEYQTAINYLVKLRSHARNSARSIIKECKNVPGGTVDNSIPMKKATDILELCDSIRKELRKDLGIEIKDIGENSLWNRVVNEESPSNKESSSARSSGSKSN